MPNFGTFYLANHIGPAQPSIAQRHVGLNYCLEGLMRFKTILCGETSKTHYEDFTVTVIGNKTENIKTQTTYNRLWTRRHAEYQNSV